MTDLIHFPDLDAVVAALETGLVPPVVAGKPVGVTREGPAFACDAGTALTPQIKRALVSAGVPVKPGKPPALTLPAWYALVPVDPAPVAAPGRALLLARDWFAVATELLRIAPGAAVEWSGVLEAGAADSSALFRVNGPPMYTLLAARDGASAGGRTAFVEARQDSNLWIEFGYRHRFAQRIAVPRGEMLLIHRDGRVLSIPLPEFEDLYARLDVVVPAAIRAAGTEPPGRIPVTLRLGARNRAGAPAPSMWVVEGDSAALLSAYAAQLSDRQSSEVFFAIPKGSPSRVVFRVRHGMQHTVPSPHAGGYVPLEELPNLYLPAATAVEPPLRLSTLRDLLAPEAARVYWVSAMAGGIGVESMPDVDFYPLMAWVDYVLEGGRRDLESWRARVLFQLTPFEEGSALGAGSAAERQPGERTVRGRRARPVATVVPAVVQQAAADADAQVYSAQTRTRQEEELAALEVTLLDPAVAVADAATWLRAGRLYADLGRSREATLAFARAAWLGASDEAWADHTAAVAGTPPAPEWLSSAPTLDRARAYAAAVVCDARPIADPAALALWLERSEGYLDQRTIWLAQTALAARSGEGGDVLRVARTADRVLARLLELGLPGETDVPLFVTFHRGVTQASGDIPIRQQLLIELLNESVRAVRSAPMAVVGDGAVERPAPVGATVSLLTLIASACLARLGQNDEARRLAASATGIPANNPVLQWLAAALRFRMQGAISNQSPRAPIPDELERQIAELPPYARYGVWRLCSVVPVLSPDPLGHAFARFRLSGASDANGGRSGDLMGALARATGDSLAAVLDAQLADLESGKTDDRDSAVAIELATAAIRLPVSHAARVVERVSRLPANPAAEPEARLTGRLIAAAVHFGLPLNAAIERLSRMAASDAERRMWAGRVLGGAMRLAAAAGYASQLQPMLRDLSTAAAPPAELAAAWFVVGDEAQAVSVLDRAERSLRQEPTVSRLLEQVPGIARGLSEAPVSILQRVVPRLAQLLATSAASDVFPGTSAHFSFLPLALFGALAAAVAPERSSLSESARRWCAEDERLLRTRLHADLAGWLRR